MYNFFDMFKQKNDHKKIVPVIFVIDASSSMNGKRMSCLNSAVRTITKKFVDYNSNSENECCIKIAILKFSSGAQWITDGLLEPADLNFSGIPCGGVTDFGSALNELNNKLSRKGFLTETNPYVAPFIYFVTDGMPTDDYAVSLKKLNDNKWYKSAQKIAVAIGDAVDFNVLNEVVGSSETVVHLNTEALLEQIMVGLCTTLFTSAVSISTVTQPIKPIAITEFDSDYDCSSRTAGQTEEFDSDCFGETCALEPPKTFDGNWDDSDWDAWDIPSQSSPKVNVSQVQFSAVVPKRFTKGDYAMIDISVYEEMYRNIVDRIIANADDEVKEVVASSQEIVDNTVIRIKLSSPDIELTDCDETQKWQGKYLTFSFPVEIPSNYAKKQVLFIATVYFNDVIATKLKFIANCSSARDQKIQLTREDVLTAFISYASQDRSRVATIIQGMQKARPDMDIFFDVESLRSGDDWENALCREIEKRDILFLCWSNYARNSEWVEKEWRYALSNKGIDAIEPVPLVSPVECPPPEELKSKHFNDRALLYTEL